MPCPGQKSVLPRVGNVVWIALNNLDSSGTTLHFEDPQPTDIRATVLVSQADRHWDLVPMLFEKAQMIWFVNATHFNHFGTVLKEGDVTHLLSSLCYGTGR
jgi:hypothetical protein